MSTDGAGNIYVVGGNGTLTSGRWDGSNGVIKYDPVSLKFLSFFAPSNWIQRNQADLDVGSAGAALVGPYVFAEGKGSTGYVLSSPRSVV